jgi:hypothetical protein
MTLPLDFDFPNTILIHNLDLVLAGADYQSLRDFVDASLQGFKALFQRRFGVVVSGGTMRE